MLLRAAGMIDRKGLAREAAYRDGSWCVAAALVESSYEDVHGKRMFRDALYTTARNVLCGSLGINSSYQSLVEYNDDFRTDKTGAKNYRHSKEEIVAALRKAAELAEDPTKIINTKRK